jgi:hypothetical protein
LAEECFLVLYIGGKNDEASWNREERFFKPYKSHKNIVRRLWRLWKILEVQAKWLQVKNDLD